MGGQNSYATNALFDQIDTNKSGTLEREEIRQHMLKNGSLGKDDEFIITALLAISDRDKNGQINRREFSKFQRVYNAAMSYKLDPAHTGLLDVLYRICVEQDGYELISLKTMVAVLQVINPQITKETLLAKMNGISEYSKADMLRIMKLFAPQYGQTGVSSQPEQQSVDPEQPQIQAGVPPQTQVMQQQVPPQQMQQQMAPTSGYANYDPMNPGLMQ